MTNENKLHSIELSDEALDSVVGGVTLGEKALNDLTEFRDWVANMPQDDAFYGAAFRQINALVTLFNGETEPSEDAVINAWKAISDSSLRQNVKDTLIEGGMPRALFRAR